MSSEPAAHRAEEIGKSQMRRLGPDYNLVVCHPDIAAEWDYEANGENRPEYEFPQSNRKRAWICSKCGYKWITSVASRTSQGGGCKACQNKVVTSSNNLAKLRPDIAREWHPTKNGDRRPDQFVPGSYKKAWWRCQYCGHEYRNYIRNKCRGDGCPNCSRFGAGPDNNLAVKYPKIAAQWHPTLNGDRTPYKIAPGSNFRAWWLCDKCGEPWQVSANSRTNYNTGCPACAGKFATSSNNLALTHPALAAELHPNRNGEWVAEKLRAGSGKVVWWIGPCGHEYDMAVVGRTSSGYGCPYCSGHRIGYGNSLAESFPDIAEEWHETKNKGSTPWDFTKYSQKKAWWQCSKRPHHVWTATIASRTFQGNGCPKCSPGVSRSEILLFCELKHIFPDAIQSRRIHGVECDIYIEGHSVAIEYDGKYYHKERQRSDKDKNRVLSENGIHLLRVREKPLPRISDWHLSLDLGQKGLTMVKKVLEALTIRIQFSDSEIKDIEHYLKSEQLVNEEEYRRLVSQLPSPPYERSLAFLYPDIAEEWDQDKNGDLDPTMFHANSTHIAYWVGQECGHKWDAPIYWRTSLRNGCRYCASKKVTPENNLAAKFPEIAAEWHPTQNGDVTPETVFPFSNKEAWWVNEKRGVFRTKISSRTAAWLTRQKRRSQT